MKFVEQALSLMNGSHSQLVSGEVETGLNSLIEGLHEISDSAGKTAFMSSVVPVCREHPIRLLCMQDPITRHAFIKPRGYSGDAELLDLYYGLAQLSDTESELGLALYRVVSSRSGGKSVRHRLTLLADRIDQAARSVGSDCRVLSVASGHFREGAISSSIINRQLKQVVCLDQDRTSIELIKKEMAGLPVDGVIGSVRSLLDRSSDYLGRFDFVYAAGLYDYLELRLAARLTARMFAMLNPGGRLLVANFAVETAEQGYMLAFMDWDLKYRTEKDVDAFLAELDPAEITEKSIYRDPENNVIYLEICN